MTTTATATTATTTATERRRAPPPIALTALFGITSFLASALLFVVEPLIARTLLPVLGGSASVWNSAMLTFQVLLLAGYLVAHVGVTRLGPRWHPVMAVALVAVAAALLPVGLRHGWQPPAGIPPVVWTLFAVAVAVGGPFLALASVSPTLQRWYGAAVPGVDPYVLYAASNVGSFLGLLAYPFVIERSIGLASQRSLWSAGYMVFGGLFLACAVAGRRSPSSTAPSTVGMAGMAVSRRDQFRWALMAAGPSLLLLGVTRHLSTDVAAIPLLWVVPLGLYLLTFVLAFSGRGTRAVAVARRLAPVLAAVAVVSLVGAVPAIPGLGLHLTAFTLLAAAVHGRLAAERPSVADLTGFYLALSAGGAVGGVIGGLVAPAVFPGVYEYPLGVVACLAWILPSAALGSPSARRIATGCLVALLALGGGLRLKERDDLAGAPPRVVFIVLALAAVAALAASRRAGQFAAAIAVAGLMAVAVPSRSTLAQLRTYYGVSRVVQNDRGWHLLISGTTVHGAQDPKRPTVPLTYYAPGGPIADVVEHTDTGTDRSIAVVGLGAGSMAAYLTADDELTYYEIDPAVIDIARDDDLFTFLSGSDARTDIVEGDGRLSLSRVPAGRHDLIVIDAFSSDAIPVHLLTREAVATYQAALTDGGVIAFHVSNNYFDLVPVVSRLAHDAGMEVLVRTGKGDVDGSLATICVVIGEAGSTIGSLRGEPGWEAPAPGSSLWTDDHADVLGALK